DRRGDPSGRVHLGAGALGRGRAAQRADRRDRRDDAGGERRNAQYRAARHRRELPGIPDPARRCVGHQDADARGLGAAGPSAEQVEAAHATSPTSAELTAIVADKGYHSNQTLVDLTAVAVRSYIAEPDRGRRDWTTMPEAQSPVYRNRRRVRGVRGKRLLRR